MIPEEATLFAFIESYITANGAAPGYKQMRAATGFSATKVFDTVNGLVRRGVLKKSPCQRFSLRLVKA